MLKKTTVVFISDRMRTEMKVVFGLSISTIRRLYTGIYYFMKYLHRYVYIMCTDGETYRYTSCERDVIIITISYSDLG